MNRLHDQKIQERLLSEIDLTLDLTVKICQTIERNRSHAKAIQQEQWQGRSQPQEYSIDVIRGGKESND